MIMFSSLRGSAMMAVPFAFRGTSEGQVMVDELPDERAARRLSGAPAPCGIVRVVHVQGGIGDQVDRSLLATVPQLVVGVHDARRPPDFPQSAPKRRRIASEEGGQIRRSGPVPPG
jgi:hypothetical protein